MVFFCVPTLKTFSEVIIALIYSPKLSLKQNCSYWINWALKRIIFACRFGIGLTWLFNSKSFFISVLNIHVISKSIFTRWFTCPKSQKYLKGTLYTFSTPNCALNLFILSIRFWSVLLLMLALLLYLLSMLPFYFTFFAVN